VPPGARAGRTEIVTALQSVFVNLRETAPEVAALHPVNGFLITLLAIVLARDAWIARSTPETA
jgi:hypothetical protein